MGRPTQSDDGEGLYIPRSRLAMDDMREFWDVSCAVNIPPLRTYDADEDVQVYIVNLHRGDYS